MGFNITVTSEVILSFPTFDPTLVKLFYPFQHLIRHPTSWLTVWDGWKKNTHSNQRTKEDAHVTCEWGHHSSPIIHQPYWWGQARRWVRQASECWWAFIFPSISAGICWWATRLHETPSGGINGLNLNRPPCACLSSLPKESKVDLSVHVRPRSFSQDWDLKFFHWLMLV